MDKLAGKPTLIDVARKAEVSITSVSRLINHTGPVNEQTRARIEAAMAELGYEPRRAASKTSEKSIAVLTGDLLNAYFPEVIRGVQEEAASYGMLVMLFNVNEQTLRLKQVLQRLNKGVADSAILMGIPFYPEIAETQARRHLPMVVINRPVSGPSLGSITVNFEDAGYRAAQHLLMLGHTRIGFIANAAANLDVMVARRAGVLRALEEAGCPIQPELDVACPPGLDMDAGYYAMSALLNLPEERLPTAVVCFNDCIAVGVEHAAVNAGLKVPDDLSVVGFDDIALAAHVSPPLTTISQPKYRIGMLAVQMLQRMMLNPNQVGACIETESPLVVRQSTAPCRQAVVSNR